MATGDVNNPKRVRFESNERLDFGDTDRLTSTALAVQDAVAKALGFPAHATAGSPVGLILTGGSTTVGSVTPGANILQINSELLVAIDADGRTLVKPSGTTLAVAIPSGGTPQQVYLYWLEAQTDTALRRKVGVATPFTENTSALATSYLGGVGVYVRAGNSASIVPDAQVGLSVQALTFLGIATNTAGTVVFDTSAATNRLSTLPPSWQGSPPVPPADNTHNGDPKTVLDMVHTALYKTARAVWKGSSHFTPTAANNYGAYTEPVAGVDETYRRNPGWITVGDGVTQFGSVDQTMFPGDATALLNAAVAALPANGGVIEFLPGVTLSAFTGNVTLPAVSIEFRSSLQSSGFATLTWTGGNGFVCATNGPGVVFRDISMAQVGGVQCIELAGSPMLMENCTIINSSPSVPSITNYAGGQMNNVYIRHCAFSAAPSAASDTAVAFMESTKPTTNIIVEDCTFSMIGNPIRMVGLNDVRNNVRFVGCDFAYHTDAVTPSQTPAMVWMQSTDVSKMRGVLVEGCSFQGANSSAGSSAMKGVALKNMARVKVTACDYSFCTYGVFCTGTNADAMVISDNTFLRSAASVSVTGSITSGLLVEGNNFNGNFNNLTDDACLGLMVSATSIKAVSISNNRFCDMQNGVYGGTAGNGVRLIEIDADYADVAITKNLFVEIMSSNIDATDIAVQCIQIAPFVRSGGTAGRWAVTITDNHFGDDAAPSALQPLGSLGTFLVSSFDFKNNQANYQYLTTTTPTGNTGDVFFTLTSGSIANGPMNVSGNTFCITNNTGADYNRHLVLVDVASGTVPSVDAVLFEDNVVHVRGASSPGWLGTAVSLLCNSYTLVVYANSAIIVTAAFPGGAHTNAKLVTGTPLGHIPLSLPTPGTVWDGNFGFTGA